MGKSANMLNGARFCDQKIVELQLDQNTKFDTSEYKSADTFCNYAEPMYPNLYLLREILKDKSHDAIIMTAREQFDSMTLVNYKLSLYEIRDINIFYAGEYGYKTPSINKYHALKALLSTYKYNKIVIYDDCEKNLKMMNQSVCDFRSINISMNPRQYYDMEVFLNLVQENGIIVQYEV